MSAPESLANPTNWRRRRCRGCGAEVIWARTFPGGEAMPVDPRPRKSGNVELFDPPAGTKEPTAVVISGQDDPDSPRLFEVEGRVRYRAHWASCPDAPRWRGRYESRTGRSAC